ncbi:ankyrin repeat-containing domain protein [Melanogaster broomeanus]|nr:ankyrin repeat-containing domain protein [Melanogaster broomeanus]
MDPITAVSTAGVAIQLFQVAIDVSSALHQYIAAIKGAESSYSELIDQITLISKTAQAAQSVLENPPSFRTSEQQALHTEWFRRDGSPARCKKELEDLLSWLRSQTGGKTLMRGIKKVFWPVKEKRIRAAIQAFDLHMPCFNIMLSLYNSSWLRGIHSEIKNEHEHARSNETAYARRELLNWLDGLNFTVKHETTRKLRQRTTGEWLLNEELYMDWCNSSIRFLWLAGKPGAGKSVLARSTIIDNLSSGLPNNETLAYFYCDFRTPRSTSTMEILRSLTVQFLRNSKSDWLSSKPFSKLVTRKVQGAGPPMDIDANSDLLRHAAKLHQWPMIVVDALDECDDLSELLDELVKLDADGHCRVLVTARPLHCINGAFTGLPSISLDDKVYAVRKDMYFHINTELESRGRLNILRQDQKEEIRVALMHKANGMFRWVQCQLDRLNKCWTADGLRDVLDTLPGTLYETYERMLSAIDQNEFSGPIARRALTWIVTAQQPLELSELAEALAIHRDKPVWGSSTATMRKTDILEICGSLVSYHEQTDIITLSHYSVKDHVSKHRRSYANLVVEGFLKTWVMKISISHLALYIIIRFGHVSLLRYYLDHYSIQLTKGANPLVYAALYADVHRFQMLLDSGLDVNVEAIVPAFYSWEGDQKMLPLIAATFNQGQELSMLLVTRTTVPRDAIHSVLQIIPMPDAPRTHDIPEPSAIAFLLQHGADPMLLVDEGGTCLHLLVTRWSARESSDLLEIARLLVEAGGDPAVPNDEGFSPFHLALRKGVLQFVQWLIARGFRPPPDAIVHAAHSWGKESKDLPTLFHLLFECGVAVGIEDIHGNNALHVLLIHSDSTDFDNTFKLLLDKGCDIDHQNHRGETPLHLAAKWHDLPRIEFLIDQGAKLPDDIINHACGGDHHGGGSRSMMALLVPLVKKHGASCQAWTAHGDNALHILLGPNASLLRRCSKSFLEPMEEFLFLIENGCDFHATGSSGITVLGTAIEHGYTALARGLISHVAQPHALIQSDSEDAEGNTILHRLCYEFQYSLRDDAREDMWMMKVELLHEAGFDLARLVNRPNYQGFTPLCIVLQGWRHRPAIVSRLLRLGAKFSNVNPLFLDNVEWASDLPRHCDTTEAYERALAKPTITFCDVVQVHHLLADHCSSKLPVSIVRLIMDSAEYWACTKISTVVTSQLHSQRCRANPGAGCLAESCFPASRVTATCVCINQRVNTCGPPRTVFGVWHGYTTVEQLKRGRQLRVQDLTSEDTLSIKLISSERFIDAIELDFFQIDIYLTIETHG